MIATALVQRKGSLSNISSRDVFVLYYLLKKYKINWASCIHEDMMESFKETNASASLLYGLLISILVDTLADLFGFKPVEISATYDTRTFSNMGYTFMGKQ